MIAALHALRAAARGCTFETIPFRARQGRRGASPPRDLAQREKLGTADRSLSTRQRCQALIRATNGR